MGALSGERWKRHHDLEEGPFQRGIKFLYNSSNPSGALFLGEGNVRGATPFMCPGRVRKGRRRLRQKKELPGPGDKGWNWPQTVTLH